MPQVHFEDRIFPPSMRSPRTKRQEQKEPIEGERVEECRLGGTKVSAGLTSRNPVVDEEIDFLMKKRKLEREREQQIRTSSPTTKMGDKSKAGREEKANVKKKRKLDTNNFPLLDGGAPERRMQIHKGQLKAQSMNLKRQRVALPIWEHQHDIRDALRTKDVLVMLGETGSGKSTQIGQFLVTEKWVARRKITVDGDKEVMVGGCIAITQPRRVAAINLARRVAQEMGSILGEEVGYSVRFDNKSSDKTKVKFVTDGMLLQEMLHDPLLKRYSAVVVDEAHERTVGTDLVMGFLRGLVYGKRAGLKVVIMSATMEVEKMALFFEKDREAALAFIKARDEKNKTIPEARREVGDVESANAVRKGKAKEKVKFEESRKLNTIPHPQRITRIAFPLPLFKGRKGLFEESANDGSSEDSDSDTEQYDGTVAAFRVPGRQFPVEIYYSPEPLSDYVDGALRTVFQLHCGEPMPGDILVFLTGQEEIEALQKLIKEYAKDMDMGLPKILVLPLYSALPPGEQQRVFQPAPERNTRKIILSTNIAETSVTVPGVRHVVDCGKVKTKQYRPRIGLESLLVTPVSKSSAMQRAGRAGREAPGKCFRLYTEPHFMALGDTAVPEILRCDIASSILTLKARGQEDVLSFDYLDSPGRDPLIKGLEHLYALGALDSTGKINELGHQMAKLPLIPALARVLIAAADPLMDCLHEVIDIIAALSVENILLTPSGDEKREQMQEARKELDRREGDHIMLLMLVREYESQPQKRSWAEKHFVSSRAMRGILDIRKQLKQYTTRLTTPTALNTPAENINPELATRILKCFLKGFSHNTARLVPDGSYRTVVGNQVVAVHPSSVLFGKKMEAIMYHEYVYTTRAYARGVSAVQMDWLVEGLEGVEGVER